MLWSRPPSSPKKLNERKEKVNLMWTGSLGEEIPHLAGDRAIQTDPSEIHRRRTILLAKQNNSWGFTLQTYGIKNKRNGEVDVMTYVDYVELDSAAWIGGMRKGDVILSVNGSSVEGLNHGQLVAKIQESKDQMRLVVLFEDCCRKVELYERFIKLKQLLSQKYRELKRLDREELEIRSGCSLNRADQFRDSVRSSVSSDWDCYSEIASPGILDSVAPNQKVWRQKFFGRSTETLDTSSEFSFECSSPFASSRESLSQAESSENLSRNASSHETLATRNSAPKDTASNPAVRDSSSNTAENLCSMGAYAMNNNYVDPTTDEVDSDTLKRSHQRNDEDENFNSEPPIQGRKRSNSAILNDLRMRLLVESVSQEANLASLGIGEDEEGVATSKRDREEDFDVNVRDVSHRFYHGVRINDQDEVTRL